MSQIHTLFPSRIYQEKILSKTASLNKDLYKESYKFQEIDVAGQRWSKENYVGGYTSYGSLAELYLLSPNFEELRKKIDVSVGRFIKILQFDIKPKDLKICSMWVNIMPPGVSHSMHIHPLSVISGTYYLQVPRGARGLKFEDPRMVSFMASPPIKAKVNRDNQRFVEMSAQVGEVLLFESWMRHEVQASQLRRSRRFAGELPSVGGRNATAARPMASDRMSISFNYDWK